jgi:hypothetical protein
VAARGVAQAVPRCGHAERMAVSVKDATESSRIPVYSSASAPHGEVAGAGGGGRARDAAKESGEPGKEGGRKGKR